MNNAEPPKYERGQAVTFLNDEGKLTGRVTAVDNRCREHEAYGCDWTYDILVGGHQGSACLFKRVPQPQVLGIAE